MKQKILAIDDSQESLNAIEYILERIKNRNFEVITAKTGKEGIQILNGDPEIKVIVLDWVMPGMGGKEVLEKLQGKINSLRVIVFTQYAGELTADEAQSLGVFQFLEKSEVREILIFTIDAAFESLRREQLEKDLEAVKETNAELFRKKMGEIIRTIEFSPKYHQAGLMILNYFGKIVSEKYPETPVKLKIEQEGLNVKLIIETPEGKYEEIEKSLHEYGLVITGKMQPEKFLSNELQVLELKQQLRMAMLQIEHKKELLKLESKNLNHALNRIDSLEQSHNKLFLLVGNALNQSEKTSQVLLDALERFSKQHNKAVNAALLLLKQKIKEGLTKEDEPEIRSALSTIKKQEPKLFQTLRDLVVGSISSTTGSYLYNWIITVTSALPR